MKTIIFFWGLITAASLSAASLAGPHTAVPMPRPASALNSQHIAFSLPRFDSILYGAAYYYEYIPYERLDKDIALMKAAGINTVRLAESTWAAWEPRDGVFDFSKLDHVLDGMDKAGIHVIVGTPTYAIPAWLAKEHSEVLVTTPTGRRSYGARQNMDIVSPVFRTYAQRIIRHLVLHVRDRPCVIGYQADNETKSYQNTGAPIQSLFLQWLKKKFRSPENMNRAYGLSYWSNAIHDWRDFPSMSGNVNASLGCAFAFFQRKMVTEYLAWQAGIIRSLKRPGQFITHNFDLEWRGSSYGIQPDVDHFAAARAFDIAGIDIYHPTADRLTGAEISFGGDLARGMRRANYLVMETQAQSMAGHQELPYPGQIRLQAFSHLASGANMVEYWPWQSIPNSVETYWKGILSHDGESNPLYEEVKRTGAEFRKTGGHLTNLRIKHRIAILFSNESLTALDWFPFSDSLNYNDILRREYDALYEMNLGCDLVNTSSTNLNDYALLIVPPLYSVSDSILSLLNAYVRNGGHVIYSCKSGFTDENVQVRPSRQPGPLREATGISYQQFTNIGHLPLNSDPFAVGPAGNEVHDWAELLVPETAHPLAWYDHPYWGKYAAITENNFGKGTVIYLGTIPSRAILHALLLHAAKEADACSVDQELSLPLIVKHGVNRYGRAIHYYFNYSATAHSFRYPYAPATDLLSGTTITTDRSITLQPWVLIVLEEAAASTNPDLPARPTVDTPRQWLDNDGHYINAHGAGVLSHNGKYYLFGEIKKGPTRLVPGQDWEDYRVEAGGISCYSSPDLVHWKYEGLALSPERHDTGSDLHTGRVIERPKVIYNEATKQYVMWMHIDKEDYGYARAGVAVSDRPQGPYRYIRSVRPDGQMSRDMTLFRDDDGKAYLVYTSENNNTMHVALLSKDYLSTTGTYKRILVGQRREAPAVFKYDKHYYLITSLCSGWDPNPATYAVADSMLGEWRQQGNPCVGPGSAATFNAQSSFVLPLGTNTDSFLFMADRWNKTDLEKSGYLWLPFKMHPQPAPAPARPIIADPTAKHAIADPSAGASGSTMSTRPVSTTTIPPGSATILRQLPAGPLTIVEYHIHLQPIVPEAATQSASQHASSPTQPGPPPGSGAWSFLRFYDDSHRQLLEYTVPVTLTDSGANTGNYTEAPPKTSYLTVGIITGPGMPSLYADSCQLLLLKDPSHTQPAPLCNISQYLRPFWRSDTIFNETVLLFASGGNTATGRLLFNPDKILSVRSFGLDTSYREGIDYGIQSRTLARKPGSHMPYKTDRSFDTTNDLAWFNLQSQWVVVTYIHHDRWTGPTPSFKGLQVPRLMNKIRTGRPVTIVAYGMSITRGLDVSGYDSVPPYMPTYMDLLVAGLKKKYPRCPFQLYNAGLPGATVSWGAEHAQDYIGPLHPDLAVIDFGMNDFWRMAPEEFRDSVQSIIRTVRGSCPETEFLLLANMKFDPGYILDTDKNKPFYTANIIGYQRVLQALEKKGVISLDMTTLSDAIYQRKKAKDCVVNPLHPNDYLARWYAQGMLALLCP